jgi:hypothetical protein
MTSFANDKYKEAMMKNIKLVYEAHDIPTLQEVANNFERISGAEPGRWEPFYYTSFAYIMMSNIEADNAKKDSFLNVAEAAIGKARALVPGESEVVALEGFIHMMRIPIDPGTRGMTYAPKATSAFEKAVALNPNNPRAIALKAQMEFGTAHFFHSDITPACTLNASALEKFDSYQPANELSPTWGKRMAEGLTEKCK